MLSQGSTTFTYQNVVFNLEVEICLLRFPKSFKFGRSGGGSVKYTSILILITFSNSLFQLLFRFTSFTYSIYITYYLLCIAYTRYPNSSYTQQQELNTASIPLQDICRVKPPVLLEPISLEELPLILITN